MYETACRRGKNRTRSHKSETALAYASVLQLWRTDCGNITSYLLLLWLQLVIAFFVYVSGVAISVCACYDAWNAIWLLKKKKQLPTHETVSSLRVFYVSLFSQCPAESLELNTSLVNTFRVIAWPESRHDFRLSCWVVLRNLLTFKTHNFLVSHMSITPDLSPINHRCKPQ